MEPESVLQCSESSTSGLYPEPNQIQFTT